MNKNTQKTHPNPFSLNRPLDKELGSELAYRDPAAVRQLFSHFADEDWALLLDSGKTSHKAAQFDLILIRPQATLCFTNGVSKVSGNINSEFIQTLNHQPFDDLRHFYQVGKEQSLSLSERFKTLPFHGGIAGYCSYDLGRYVEAIPERAKHDIGLPELAFGLYNFGFISDHQAKKSHFLRFSQFHNNFSVDDFYKTLNEFVEKAQQHSSNKDSSNKQNNIQFNDFKLTTNWQSNMKKSDYCQKFSAVHSYIHAGDCYQVNLAQRFSAEYTGHPWSAYLKLSEYNQAPFSAYFNLGKQQILSLSPERFIQIEVVDGKQKVITQPIKGTRPRSKDLTEDKKLSDDLLSSEKDRAENLMIVDLLRNDIGRSAEIGSVKVSKLFELQSFPSVHHLVSTIEATLAENEDALSLLKNCFPGGSITGAPKIRAMEIIEELEPHRRSIYCGSVLYYDFRGFLDSSITIRTLASENSKVYTWGGGGLVADSQADSEYQETYHKLSRILPVLK